MKTIILLGPPGSGKGTQAEKLCQDFNLEYVGSGNLLRARKSKGDFTGEKIASYIDQGKRVSTPIIFAIWMEKLEELFQKQADFVLDGSPRTVPEAELLEEALDWYGFEKQVFFVDCSAEEVKRRLSTRKVCPVCRQNYAGGDKCEKCGADLISRADDSIDGINERLRWFEAEVRPVIEYYQNRGDLTKINGDQSPEEVYDEIKKQVRN
jgi:adenylate kinase